MKADDESKFQGARGSPSDSPAPRVVITWEAVLGTLAPQLRGIVDAVRTSLRRRCFGGSFRACVHIWCTRACVAAAQTQTIAILAPPTAVIVAGGASVELLQATHSGLAWRLLRKVSSFGLLVLRSAGGWHCRLQRRLLGNEHALWAKLRLCLLSGATARPFLRSFNARGATRVVTWLWHFKGGA